MLKYLLTLLTALFMDLSLQYGEVGDNDDDDDDDDDDDEDGKGSGGDGKRGAAKSSKRSQPKIDQSSYQAGMNEMKARKEKVITRLQKQLDAITASLNDTTLSKEDLEAKLEEIRTSNLTGFEKEKDGLTKQIAALTKERDDLKKAAERWENTYREERILREITSAATKHGAIDPNHIAQLTRSATELVEELDDKGVGKGTFKVQMKVDLDKGEGPQMMDVDKGVGAYLTANQYLASGKGTGGVGAGRGSSGGSGSGGGGGGGNNGKLGDGDILLRSQLSPKFVMENQDAIMKAQREGRYIDDGAYKA